MTDLLTSLKQIEAIAENAIITNSPPPPIDVASWWIPQPGKFVRTCFVRQLADGRLAIYYIKNPAAWPWDINLVDQNGIYFRVTENDDGTGWPPNGTPSTYRLYIQQDPGATSKGFKISPRYYDPTRGRILVSNVTDVPTMRMTNCNTGTQNHLGPAASYIQLVKGYNFGGQLGTQDTLICEYYYTGTPPTTRERFYLTQLSGWVGWDVSALKSGSWVVSNSSMHNTFVSDTVQVPIFPCPVVL